ncbi:hypothetical protein LCGC14_1144910 [marine sediment metagenome]|uniref:Uncharacterized protein n=1 Tax=marine sediment metagenome TaxID=412755 RepID=A0A0F9M1Z8_9ZZZZ
MPDERAFETAKRRGLSPLVIRLGQRIIDRGEGAPEGSAFLPGGTLEGVLPPEFPDPTGEGVSGPRPLTFAQTEAGARLRASLEQGVERTRGQERLKLESTIQSLARELLPPADVETAMMQVRRGELVKSKLAFQAVLENLADASRNVERRRDIDLAEENERRTLKEARSRIVINMLGKDLGLAILFALGSN